MTRTSFGPPKSNETRNLQILRKKLFILDLTEREEKRNNRDDRFKNFQICSTYSKNTRCNPKNVSRISFIIRKAQKNNNDKVYHIKKNPEKIYINFHILILSLADLKFSEDHEWVKVEGNIATIGITDHAQDQMGDITFIDEAEVGEEVEKGGQL